MADEIGENHFSRYWGSTDKIFKFDDIETLKQISWDGFLDWIENENIKLIKIKLQDDFIHEIDKEEFIRYYERYGHLENIKWKNRLGQYEYYDWGTKEYLECPTKQYIDCTKIFEAFQFKIEIFAFIKDKIIFLKKNQGNIILHQNEKENILKTVTIEEFIDKMIIIFKFGFGIIKATDLRDLEEQINKDKKNKVRGI
jgi:hypothetical protein